MCPCFQDSSVSSRRVFQPWRLSRPITTATLCCLLLGACADSADSGPETYIVGPQDTLYSIAWRHDLDFRDLARWNTIGADFHISVGQALVLDGPPRPGPSAAPLVGQARPPPSTPPVAVHAPLAAAARGSSRWIWPTEHAAAPRPGQGGGILLVGKLGQDVRAASAGRVVYTGSGLRSYGNLIIIKHVDGLLSAYAHNREMLVRDGQEVVAGQVIAHMGLGPQQFPVLYFEIRQNGKPIDPLPYLSK